MLTSFGAYASGQILYQPILQQDLWGLLIAHQCRSTRQWQQSEINSV
ncbi:hypothetical protein AB0758_30800 [Tolypothrix bouteillei VB521301_2]